MRSGTGEQRCGGFTLVEMIIGLAIGAVLMVAVGVAIASAAKSIEANQDFDTAVKTSRLALMRLAADVRQADICHVGTGSTTVGEHSALVLHLQGRDTATGRDNTKRSYAYSNSSKQLLLDMQAWSAPSDSLPSDLLTRRGTNVHVLAGNISSLSFKGIYKTKGSSRKTDTSGNTADDDLVYLASVQIDATITVGKQTFQLSDAVAVQRYMPVR